MQDMMVVRGNVVVPFAGSDAQREANRATHAFDYSDPDDVRCWNCDCRPWGRVADYPCGAEPEREYGVQVMGL